MADKLFYDETFPGEKKHALPLTTNRDPMTDHSTAPPKSNLVNHESYWGSLQEYGGGVFTGAKVTQRYLYLQGTPQHE